MTNTAKLLGNTISTRLLPPGFRNAGTFLHSEIRIPCSIYPLAICVWSQLSPPKPVEDLDDCRNSRTHINFKVHYYFVKYVESSIFFAVGSVLVRSYSTRGLSQHFWNTKVMIASPVVSISGSRVPKGGTLALYGFFLCVIFVPEWKIFERLILYTI